MPTGLDWTGVMSTIHCRRIDNIVDVDQINNVNNVDNLDKNLKVN